MAEDNFSTRLAEIESLLERSRRRFDEGARLVEEAHQALASVQQALIGRRSHFAVPAQHHPPALLCGRTGSLAGDPPRGAVRGVVGCHAARL